MRSGNRGESVYSLLELCLLLLADTAGWESRSPSPYPSGQSAIVAGDDGRIYLFGGYNTNPPGAVESRRLQIYEPATDSWTLGAPLPVFCIGDSAIQMPDGRIHLFSNVSNKVAVYHPSTDTWEQTVEAVWTRYAARSVCTPGVRYFIFGGERPDDLTLEYFPATLTAVSRTPIPNVPDPPYSSLRYPGVGLVADGRIDVIGGLPHLPELHGALDQVARYDTATDSWTTHWSPLPTPRFTFAYVTGWNGFLYAIGGSDTYTMQAAPYFDVVEVRDPRDDTWHVGPALPEGRREASAAIDSQGVIYVFGGCGPPDGAYTTSVFALDTRIGIGGSLPADFDRDGDVDSDDVDHFRLCATGPRCINVAPECAEADLDGDLDIDQTDFAYMQRSLWP